jgi:hypothetical protein
MGAQEKTKAKGESSLLKPQMLFDVFYKDVVDFSVSRYGLFLTGLGI